MLYDYFWFENVYSAEECKNIYEKALEYKQKNTIDVPADGKNLDCFGIFSKDLEKELDKFFSSIYSANRESFGFKIYDKSAIEYCSINSYDVNKSYGCHRDAKQKGSSSDIKLTAILNLSTEDYTGGEFLFHFGDKKIPIPQLSKTGNILIFPSFLYHEVTPVLTGKRISLSAWIDGPNWR